MICLRILRDTRARDHAGHASREHTQRNVELTPVNAGAMLAGNDATTLVHPSPRGLHLSALRDAGARQRLHQPLLAVPLVAARRHQPGRPGRRVWRSDGAGRGAIRGRRDRRSTPLPGVRTPPPQPQRTQRRPPGAPIPIRPPSPRSTLRRQVEPLRDSWATPAAGSPTLGGVSAGVRDAAVLGASIGPASRSRASAGAQHAERAQQHRDRHQRGDHGVRVVS